MKDIKIYLLVLGALASSAVSFLLNGSRASNAQAPDKNVVVVNTPSNPAPVAMQGITNVAGTVSLTNSPASVAVSNFPSLQHVAVTNFPNPQRVSVSNFPHTQTVSVSNLPGTQSVVPAGTPTVLRTLAPVFGHVRLPLFGNGSVANLSGQLAIGSITTSAQAGSGDSAIDVFLLTTDCAGNELERLNLIEINRGSTRHVNFPTPQLAPSDGPRNRFCVEADIYPNSGSATTIYITLAGSLR